jgi:glycosyltransferase involved in cell wall biosynthesis
MRVALVHDWLTGMRGGEKCLEVFCELFPRADLYTLFHVQKNVSHAINSMRVETSWLNSLPGIERYYRYCLPLFPLAIESFALRDYDLVLSSSHCVAKGVRAPGALHIAYLHSPMRYVWDMHDAYFAQGDSRAARLGMACCRGYLQRWDLRSAGRVDFFVANSRNVAAKITKLYRREAEVIHPPVDLDKFHIGPGSGRFYLIVSALVPYKNIQLAVAAFNRLKLPLKIAGDGPSRRSLEKQAGPNIEFLGWVEDARLAELYAECEALIFPGEEDFGIVPLEAQASGRPVIAYGKGGVKESVVGVDDVNDADQANATGIFYADATADKLIEAVERYQTIRTIFRPSRLREHAKQFSRLAFKTQIMRFIEAKLEGKVRNGPQNVKTA